MGTTFKRVAAGMFDPGGIFAGAYQDDLYGGDDYSVSEPPETPFADDKDTTLEDKRKKLQARNAARENFIATGGQGLLAEASTEKKTLLGK